MRSNTISAEELAHIKGRSAYVFEKARGVVTANPYDPSNETKHLHDQWNAGYADEAAKPQLKD